MEQTHKRAQNEWMCAKALWWKKGQWMLCHSVCISDQTVKSSDSQTSCFFPKLLTWFLFIRMVACNIKKYFWAIKWVKKHLIKDIFSSSKLFFAKRHKLNAFTTDNSLGQPKEGPRGICKQTLLLHYFFPLYVCIPTLKA